MTVYSSYIMPTGVYPINIMMPKGGAIEIRHIPSRHDKITIFPSLDAALDSHCPIIVAAYLELNAGLKE